MATTRRPNGDGLKPLWFPQKRVYRSAIWLTVDGVRKRRYVYAKTQKRVGEKIRTLRAEAEKGLAIGEAKWTTGAWLEEFVAGRAKIGRKPGTIQDYRYYLDYYLIPRLGSIPLKELRRPKLQAFVDQLVREKVLSPRTIRHCITKLRAALNHAVAAGIIETSPAVVIDLPAIHQVEKNPYSLEEVKRFLEAVMDHRFRALFTLSILSGLREGEALALRWSDLDLESGTIEVNNTLHRREGAWYFDSAKTASSNRTVSMVPLLMNVLAQHRESQRAERLLAGNAWQDYGVVFATHKGGPLGKRNVFRDYKKMQTQANLRKQTYHDLRHATANLMMNSGGTSLAEVSKILGHSQLSITSDYYKHLSIESQRATMDKLQAALTS
jgi:integrase